MKQFEEKMAKKVELLEEELLEKAIVLRNVQLKATDTTKERGPMYHSGIISDGKQGSNMIESSKNSMPSMDISSQDMNVDSSPKKEEEV